MVFQINWINMSRDLIEEQFDQKVNLAIGSALTDFNTKYKTELDIDNLQSCGDEEDYKYLSVQKKFMNDDKQVELEYSLGRYMNCYGIDEKYNVKIFDDSCTEEEAAYCSSISTQASCKTDYQLGVSFVSRNDYLYDKMKFMILSSILIFILLTTVSFMILNALVKQKRITENNIDFFNNTAHELKTPLTNISLALNLLRKKYPDIKEDKYSNIIKTENSKLSSQIERVLFLSKMENGEYELKKEPINLNILLSEVVDNMQMIIEEKSGVVNINQSNQGVMIIGDYYHLSNVFRNLIDNALKYCTKIPVVRISVIEDEEHVSVQFEDNGIGINTYDQEHIFEKFQRVNTGDIREAKGFGLGLAYVKTVIEMHKGLIHVYSEPNQGSRFELLIPNS